MTALDLVDLSALIDDAKYFVLVRQHRWSKRMRCLPAVAVRLRNGRSRRSPRRDRCHREVHARDHQKPLDIYSLLQVSWE